MKHCLICINCKKKYKPSIFLLRCDECNSVVKVEYNHPPKDKNSMMNSLMNSSFFSLGDGDTPIIHLRNLGKKIEHNFLYAKLEFLSPTGSFKDRGSNILMNIAKNFGVNEFVEDSSGNAGASLAAHASFMNINANIFNNYTYDQNKPPYNSIFLSVFIFHEFFKRKIKKIFS